MTKTISVAFVEPTAFPVSLIPSDGHTTCLIHRQWEWTMANYVPTMPRCTICGGIVDPRLTAHCLCEKRKELGLPTPQLDSTPRCSCAKCLTAVSIKAGVVR